MAFLNFLVYLQEINRSNRRIIKQTFNSDVLEIIPNTKAISSDVPQKVAKPSNKDADAEEDDWESMFDDKGECLDQKMIDEISAAVGKVAITKPKSDYRVSIIVHLTRVATNLCRDIDITQFINSCSRTKQRQ